MKTDKRVYADEITALAGARGISESVAALIMEDRMKEAALLRVYQTENMRNEE